MRILTTFLIGRIFSGTVVYAGVQTLQIQRLTYGWDFRMFNEPSIPADRPLLPFHQEQLPLQGSSDFTQNRLLRAPQEAGHSGYRLSFHSMDVDFIWTSMYRTTIGVGSPQVQFRAQVDTSWGPLFVPSIYSTYAGQFWGLWTWGNETQDTVLVGDLEIENQTCESVEYWKPNPFERDDLYDAVLGLALRDIRDYNTTLHSPSLFRSMLQQRLLDDEVFALRLSRTDEEIGELTLGSIPDYIDKDELVHVPLTQNYEGVSRTARYYSSNGWQVALNDITVSHDRSRNRSILASSHTAILSNSFP